MVQNGTEVPNGAEVPNDAGRYQMVQNGTNAAKWLKIDLNSAKSNATDGTEWC